MATFEPSLLDDTTPRAARVVALALLDDLTAERERLRESRESETLHDFRVALRRLRSWLRALAPALEGSLPPPAIRRLRRTARESNVGRDAEVFLTWLTAAGAELPSRDQSAVRWLAERFERQQHEADTGLTHRLDRTYERTRARLASRLATYHVVAHVHAGVREPVFATTMANLLRQQAEELRRRLRRVQSADDILQAHQARIAGKRLRYILEPVAPHVEAGTVLVEQLRGLQDTLGDLHDAHIWLLVLRDVVAELAVEEGRRMARAFTAVGEVVPTTGRRKGPSRSGLVALARLAQERAAAAYERFSNDWEKGTAKRFFRDLNRAAKALAARAPRKLEIERKFLLKQLPPDMPKSQILTMDQGYLPGERVVERLRKVREGRKRTYLRTIKVGTGIVRAELEEATTPEVFATLWPLTRGRRLTKRRHLVPTGHLTWEIDEFTDRDLVLAEIELPAADTTVEFPDWLAPHVDHEVTTDPAYLNWSLAR